MLDELDIRDFVLAEHVRIRLDPGFTVITGETGAGKSLIVDALAILLGERPDADVVRVGANAARLEGTFITSPDDEGLRDLLAEAGIEAEDNVLIVSREVPINGRVISRINGRAVVQSALTAIGNRLVDIHGQSQHLAILRPTEHVHYLDRFAGTLPARALLAEKVAELSKVRTAIDRLHQDARERTRRQEQLSHEVQEIDGAKLVAGEEDELRRERLRLANAEQLTELAAQTYAALTGGDATSGAADVLGEATAFAGQLARLDPELGYAAEQLEALQSQVDDLARALRTYSEQIEFSPERLQAIEERLGAISSLKRKYGATVEEVLGYCSGAVRELEELSTSEERIADFSAQERVLLDDLRNRAEELSRQRRAAARKLSSSVDAELGDLGLSGGRFGVRFDLRADPTGLAVELPMETIASVGASVTDIGAPVACDRTGVDRVEFLVTLNPGEPLRPLARVASGGETSRLMLALKTILGEADAVPTLVFDEVDVGVGGRSGRIVGDKLAKLATHHQVISITHLPQIASLADLHLTVSKQVTGDRTSVTARELRGQDRLDEIAAMLGGITAATRASAEELLSDATH